MKITMYELLGLVKDDKAPKRIKFRGIEWELKGAQYQSLGTITLGNIWNGYNFNILNDKVEIIEEPTTCEEFAKMFQENCKMFQPEEKEIPLKINKIIPSQNYVISDSKNHSIDERLEIIRKRLYANELYILDIANTLNEIIDYFHYLKSKGDE